MFHKHLTHRLPRNSVRTFIAERHANYAVEMITATRVVIRDMGPWDKHPSVTNDVEWVLADLINKHGIDPNVELMYYDSNGDLDIIIHDGVKFEGFKVFRGEL